MRLVVKASTAYFLLVLWRPQGAAMLKEEVFQEKVESVEVISVVGGRANLPCDLTPPFPSDQPHLILFYKDVYGTPIYSYDMRQKGGRHWKDNRTLGNRAFFHYKETGMRSETGAMQIASFLTIEALRPEDTGFYRCRVDFKEAPTKNTKIHLNLIVPSSPPLVRSEHGKALDKVSEPVQEGSTLTLICETQGGEPLPRLTWKRNQIVIDDVVEEVDPQNRVVRNYLKMPNLHRKDHDEVLSCLASNTNLTAPQITYININMVFPPIRAKIVREWSFFNAGQAYNVSCQVLGSRPPAVTAIYVGPSQLREVNYHVSPDGNVSTTTVIFIPDESDQGKFLSCRAENVQLSSSAVEDQWKLQIHYIPQATLTLTSNMDGGELIRKGDTVYLQCEVKANPSVHTIQWTFEGQAIDPSKKQTNLFITEDTLIIRSVSQANNGVYQCLAKNQVGQGLSNTQTVNVKVFPSCANSELQKLVEVDQHESVQLKCQYHSSSASHGPLSFGWSMNSTKDSVDFPKSDFTVDGEKSILTFSAKTDMDFGTVTCNAADQVGPTNNPCTFQIVPKGQARALRNCSAVNQTFESLSIVCMNSSHKSPNQRYILEVFNSGNAEMMVNISTNQPVFHVRGLSSGTEYRVKIYSVNDSGGVSEHAVFQTFTLQPAEKQLAATTTDLASNNPMRLLPIVAVLIAIVLLLVILAVIFVIIIRGRNGCANSSANELLPSNATLASYSGLRQPLEQTEVEPLSGAEPQLQSTVASSYHGKSPSYQYKHQQSIPQMAMPTATELNSPDLILPAASKGRQQPQIIGSSGSCYAPPNSIRSQKGYDEIILTGAGGGTSSSKISSSGGGPPIAKKSIMKKPPVPLPSNQTVLPVAPPVVNQSECQYAQLIFDKNHRHFSADDSVLYLNTNSSSPKYQTTYATIDHSRRHHSKKSNSNSRKGLMHSASCPFKGEPHHQQSSVKKSCSSTNNSQQTTPARQPSIVSTGGSGSRSGTLKRVAFKDEQTVHDDGASSIRLIPSTISVSDDAGSEAEPVIPAPPPGYESQPGFSVVTDELLPPSSQHKKPDSSGSSSSSNKKCSKNNDLESRL